MAVTQELEQKAEQDRARIADTLTSLRSRMAPKELAEQAFEYARENGGAEFVRNLGGQAKSNPLPIVLIAAGIGWLLFGRPAPIATPSTPRIGSRFWGTGAPARSDLDDRFDDLARDNVSRYTDPSSADRARPYASGTRDAVRDSVARGRDRAASTFESASGTAAATYESATDATGRAWSTAQDAASATGDAVASAAAAARDTAARTADAARDAAGDIGERAAAMRDTAAEWAHSATEGVSDSVRNARDYASDLTRRAAEGTLAARDYASGLGESVADQAHGIGAYASDVGASAASRAREAGYQARYAGERMAYRADRARAVVRRVAREQPLVVGAVGLALGAILGALLPRSQREDELMGETADDVKAAALDKARAGFSEAKEAGARIGERIRDEASAQGISAGSMQELVRTVGDKVTSVAAAAREGVESEMADAKAKAEGGMDEAVAAAETTPNAVGANNRHEAANASADSPALTRFSELDPSPTLSPDDEELFAEEADRKAKPANV